MRMRLTRETVKRRILDLLDGSGTPRTLNDLFRDLYPSVRADSTVRLALAELLESGEVRTVPVTNVLVRELHPGRPSELRTVAAGYTTTGITEKGATPCP